MDFHRDVFLLLFTLESERTLSLCLLIHNLFDSAVLIVE